MTRTDARSSQAGRNRRQVAIMYKKILIPTDGSPLSTAAAHAGVELARQCDASVIGVNIAPPYQYPVNVEIIVPEYPSEEEYQAAMRRHGDEYLAQVHREADALGVSFSGTTVFAGNTAQAIIHAAEKDDCDLIFIGSHGRSGLGQLLLGSVTNKILSTCKIPVLVYRVRQEPGKG
jgi:nucleotide-binding universal stress UspA family protein